MSIIFPNHTHILILVNIIEYRRARSLEMASFLSQVTGHVPLEDGSVSVRMVSGEALFLVADHKLLLVSSRGRGGDRSLSLTHRHPIHEDLSQNSKASQRPHLLMQVTRRFEEA